MTRAVFTLRHVETSDSRMLMLLTFLLEFDLYHETLQVPVYAVIGHA